MTLQKVHPSRIGDHQHDDRYLTETEVDAALEEKTDKASVTVSENAPSGTPADGDLWFQIEPEA
jgi:hypothetical protein